MIKKLRLKLYKSRKIREDKTPTDRYYYVDFKVKIIDSVNPHEFDRVFNMVVPAKATFFAKRKLRKAIMRKIDVSLVDINRMTYEEWQEYERDRERFLSENEGRVVSEDN
jgi:hypothetical protein